MHSNKHTLKKEISRKEALQKIRNYGKYAALTALGTYLLLNPKTAQASSSIEESVGNPNDDF